MSENSPLSNAKKIRRKKLNGIGSAIKDIKSLELIYVCNLSLINCCLTIHYINFFRLFADIFLHRFFRLVKCYVL